MVAMCATALPQQRKSKELVGWLELAALLHRYSGSSETALEQDLKACRETDPVGALLKNLKQIRPALVAHPSDFAGALADRSGLLALYIACTHRGILDFYTGAKILLQKDVDRHHILARTIPRKGQGQRRQRCQYRFHCWRRKQVDQSIGP